MANIITPERYSHDTLREQLVKLFSIKGQFEEAIEKEDLKAMKRLNLKFNKQFEEFEKAFHEHDIEMQFVDKLISEHQHEQQVNKNWTNKWSAIQNVSKVVALGASLLGLYFMFKH